MAAVIIAEVGKQLAITTLLKSITTLTTTSTSAYTLWTALSSHTGPNKKSIEKKLRELDIMNDVKIIDEILKEIPIDKLYCDSIRKSVESIVDIRNKIDVDLNEIYHKLAYNESMWFFTSWRSYDCSRHLTNLERNKKIMDSRLNKFNMAVDTRAKICQITVFTKMDNTKGNPSDNTDTDLIKQKDQNVNQYDSPKIVDANAPVDETIASPKNKTIINME